MSLPSEADIPRQLAAASSNWATLRRMAAYGAFDGWSLTILGALTLICGGYGSALGLLISFALLGTGVFELRSVGQLRRLSPAAVAHLGYNQLALAGMLIAYALISLIQSHHDGGVPAEIQQAIEQTGGSTSGMQDQLSSAMEILYSGLIAFALAVQGGTALYYFSRGKYLQRYLEQTPAWIQQMQRERGEISL